MLGFSCFLVATIIAVGLWLRRHQRRTPPWIVAAAVAAILMAAGIILWPGKLFIQRGLTNLANPCGVVWLGLLALTFHAWHRRHRSVALPMLLVFLTVTANNGTAHLLMRWWQQPFASTQPLDQGPFDIVFVLGGGTALGFNDNPQLDISGDRVLLAARLYHAGRTPLLGCTGRRMGHWTSEAQDPATQTTALLAQIGIPTDKTIPLSGRNTQEELAGIRDAVQTNGWDRIGLVTSAWHLRRAMRLARNVDLHPQPLPADFRGQLHHGRDWSIIPDPNALLDVTFLCKEWLAAVVGR